MKENSQKLYDLLRRTLPLPKTDRRSDLQDLLRLSRSFILYSVKRNGTTTLLREFAERKGARYVDAQGKINSVTDLEECVGQDSFVLDKTSTFFRRVGYQEALRCLTQLTSNRQIGLRLHAEHDEDLVSSLVQRGFALTTLGKMQYGEWSDIVKRYFSEQEVPELPPEITQFAYHAFHQLNQQMYYLAEAVRMAEETPGASALAIRQECVNYNKIHFRNIT